MAKANAGDADKYLEGRPTHIVVFREPSEKNVSVLSKTLKVNEVKNVTARASCTILSSRGSVHTRVYQRLGVAVANLDSEEVQELKKQDSVQTVVPNERRKLPPLAAARDAGDGPDRNGNSPAITYLHGMRAAIDAMLQFHGEAGSPGGFATPMFAAPSATALLEPAAATNYSWCLRLVGLSPTYTLATGDGVSVAVLDTGIDLTHPDFTDRVTEGDNAKSFVPGEGVQDGNGHGTHCAGVIAGPRDSAGGRRYGVAPDAQLLIGKVLDNSGSGWDDQILDGMDWAADQGASIISMSLGSERSMNQAFAAPYERVAERLLQRGVLVVAAGGNSSDRPFSTAPVENPAACPSIKAVAAVDRNRKVAYFSCAQLDSIGTLDIAAPGVAVYSAWTGGGFRSISGTSMATPHVAGLAALYRQRQPDLSAQALWNLLAAHAQGLGNGQDFGRGLAQAPRA